MNFTGKTAVVTGGSRGIGRAICLELARGGANVMLCYAGNEQAALDTVACLLYTSPGSLEVLEGCKLEASLAAAQPADRFQFLRLGYFCADSKDSKPGALVFNRAVSLKDGFKPGK